MKAKVIAQGKLCVVTRMVKKARARTCGAMHKFRAGGDKTGHPRSAVNRTTQ